MRVVSARADGRSCRAVARPFCVLVQCVRFERCGMDSAIQADRIGPADRRKPRFGSGRLSDWVPAKVRACPQTTTRRLQALLAARGTRASRDAVWRTLRSPGCTFKKKTPPAEEHDDPEADRRRERWQRRRGTADQRKLNLHRRDLHQHRHSPAPGMGAQRREAVGKTPGTGTRRPSSQPCAMIGSTLPEFSTPRSTAPPSKSMPKRRRFRRSSATTSSSRTLPAATKPKRCARKSEAQATACCSSRPAAPIST